MIPYKQRQRWYKIIFEADTPAGKRFDVVLLVAILLSLFVIVLDSVAGVRAQWGYELQVLEWMFTLLFTAEYILRIVVSPRPRAYIRSTFGLIDLLSVLPNYLEFMAPNIHYLMVIRLFRMLRVFRVFKLHQFVSDADTIQFALKAIGRKMLIFFVFISIAVVVVGTLLYVVEYPVNSGFSDIPSGIYWAVVTLTTVGYGDLVPITPMGRFIAGLVMMLGYMVLALPAGMISAEFIDSARRARQMVRFCSQCFRKGHEADARCCKYCGAALTNP